MAKALQGQAEVIVCEALIDALTFWNAGYRNVTSCYGVNGLTEELLAALKTSGAQRILIAFDRDEAGDRGAEALAKRLMAEGLECFRLLFPKGMDANEYACAVKPADKSLGRGDPRGAVAGAWGETGAHHARCCRALQRSSPAPTCAGGGTGICRLADRFEPIAAS